MNEPILLTVEDAARVLSIGRSRLYMLLRSGEIESVSLGRSRRIPAAAIQTYVDALREEQRRTEA